MCEEFLGLARQFFGAISINLVIATVFKSANWRQFRLKLNERHEMIRCYLFVWSRANRVCDIWEILCKLNLLSPDIDPSSLEWLLLAELWFVLPPIVLLLFSIALLLLCSIELRFVCTDFSSTSWSSLQ